MPITVLLADPHAILRKGLKSVLHEAGFSIVGECGDGQQAVKLAGALRPDITVLEISMPRLNGVDAAREILQISPRTKIVALTVHREDQYVLEALRAGVKSYVLKTDAATSLLQAIHETFRGYMYLSPGVTQAIVDACRAQTGAPVDPLAPRELRILQLIAEGRTMREIATELSVTAKTVESYRTNIVAKLDIHQTANLVRYAIRRGLVKP